MHSHSHHVQTGKTSGTKRLLISVILNLLITVTELIGGLISGSLALLSDALHNFSDTASLGISLVARRVAARGATPEKTFGYKRAELIGAFINLVTLVLIALYLIWEAVDRFLSPHPVDASVMLVVASIGLLANLLTAVLLRREVHGSLNVRSAFLHVVADAVSSVGVVLGGLLMIYFDVPFVDPLLTLLISLYILIHSYRMLRETISILMESVPGDIDLSEVVEHVQRLDAVQDVHHVHVWQLDEAHTALEAHVVIDRRDVERMEVIKRAIKKKLADAFDIHHSTLEFEFVPCDPGQDPRCYDVNGHVEAG